MLGPESQIDGRLPCDTPNAHKNHLLALETTHVGNAERQNCESAAGQIHFLERCDNRLPPLLQPFTGSSSRHFD